MFSQHHVNQGGVQKDTPQVTLYKNPHYNSLDIVLIVSVSLVNHSSVTVVLIQCHCRFEVVIFFPLLVELQNHVF